MIKEKRSTLKVRSLSFPRKYILLLKMLVSEGIFLSQSEAIRYILKFGLAYFYEFSERVNKIDFSQKIIKSNEASLPFSYLREFEKKTEKIVEKEGSHYIKKSIPISFNLPVEDLKKIDLLMDLGYFVNVSQFLRMSILIYFFKLTGL